MRCQKCKNLSPSDVFFQAPKAPKPVFGVSSPVSVGWGGDTPSRPCPSSFDAFGVPISSRRFLDPTNKTFCIYAYAVREEGARVIFLQGGPQFEVTPLQH